MTGPRASDFLDRRPEGADAMHWETWALLACLASTWYMTGLI